MIRAIFDYRMPVAFYSCYVVLYIAVTLIGLLKNSGPLTTGDNAAGNTSTDDSFSDFNYWRSTPALIL